MAPSADVIFARLILARKRAGILAGVCVKIPLPWIELAIFSENSCAGLTGPKRRSRGLKAHGQRSQEMHWPATRDPRAATGGLLEVTADAKAWQQEIEGMKRDLRDRVNRAWGGNLVRDVEFLAAKPGLKVRESRD